MNYPNPNFTSRPSFGWKSFAMILLTVGLCALALLATSCAAPKPMHDMPGLERLLYNLNHQEDYKWISFEAEGPHHTGCGKTHTYKIKFTRRNNNAVRVSYTTEHGFEGVVLIVKETSKWEEAHIDQAFEFIIDDLAVNERFEIDET